jgi:hypothetical protein
LIFLVAMALVFGLYYVWLGIQNFLRTGGQGVTEATEQANTFATATAVVLPPTFNPTPPFSPTPVPTCTDFVVIVPNARVRAEPRESAPVLTSFFEGDTICVLGRPSPESEWYTIDYKPATRRIDTAYMHESVIAAANPTPTPTLTSTPLPTVTPTESLTPSETPIPQPTETRDPRITNTPLPSITPTPTVPRQSA